MDAIMVVYFKQLQILYNAGARNFVLLGVPRRFYAFEMCTLYEVIGQASG